MSRCAPRQFSNAQTSVRSSRRIRAAVEAMEARVLLSTYTVNTFVDQTDPPSSTTVSLRDAVALAVAHPGSNVIDVPAGDYKLNNYIQISAPEFSSSTLVIQSVGGFATLDVQSKALADIDNNSSLDSSVSLNGLILTGAAYDARYALDGAIINSSNLTATNCIISGNACAGLSTGDESTTTLTGVTISNNKSGTDSSQGNDLLTIIDSTISGNQGPGIVASTVGGVKLYDSTVSNNQGYGVDISTAAFGLLANTIVAGNVASADVTGFSPGSSVSDGGNVIGVVGTSTGWLASDKTGTTGHPLDARLAPLGNYGGLTQTMPPLAGSPALAAGKTSVIPAGVTTDQRGKPRIVSGTVDSGAVEIQGSPKISITPPAAQTVTFGGTISLGSFTAAGVSGPFVGEIDWGDGTPDTILNFASAGAITAQKHTFGASGVIHVGIAVTDSAGDLSNAATFNVTVKTNPLVSYVVNTAKDQSDATSSTTVSLRDAISRANKASGPVSITFSPTVFASPQTITMTGAELTIGGNPYGIITITGPAAGLKLTTSNNDTLTVLDHASLTLSGITLLASVANSGFITLNDCLITTPGAGIATSNEAVINDCTITGNGGDGIDNTDQAVIADSTITANYSGINNSSGATLTLSNSIVAGSTGDPLSVSDVSGVIHSLGHNLIGEKDFSSGWTASDLTGTIAHPLDPKLSLLGDFGGPTPIQFPLPGSPALGAGSAALVPAGVTTDQRGFSRIVGGKVDIGAYQTQSTTAITYTAPGAQSGTVGTSVKVSLGSISDSTSTGPFIETLTWGDGSPAVVFTQKSAGSLGTMTHTFLAKGALTNTIDIVDHAGDLKVATFTFTANAAPLKTFVVNTIKDTTDATSSTTVSLRDAINRADASFGPVNITFDPTVFKTAQTIKLASDIPDLKTDKFGLISFIGPAAGVTVKSHLVNATNFYGESYTTGNNFNVDGGVAASFSNITFYQFAFENAGAITFMNSSIIDNIIVGANGGAILNSSGGSVNLIDSTISGNDAELQGSPGGPYGGFGGAIANYGTLSVVNSTISGNYAGHSYTGGIDNHGVATISDSTIAANVNGGLYNAPASGSSIAKVTIANTIVAGNSSVPNAEGDANGPITSLGHNLIGATNGSTGWTSADLKGTLAHLLNPVLSPLGNNGGPTQTQIPLPGSPALGAGSVSLIASGVTTDQRGLPRMVGGKVDIGSVEIQANTPFGGSPAPFTTIQAENFDLGGQGSGYYDPGNVNRGGLYRPNEGVGIGAIPSADGGGYFVGYTQLGEFLKYTVSVAATGTYTLNFRVSSTPKGGTFQLNVDGTNVTGALQVPNTGNWNTYQIVSKTGVHLTAGTHVLELLIDSVGSAGVAGNFDWIQAVKTG